MKSGKEIHQNKEDNPSVGRIGRVGRIRNDGRFENGMGDKCDGYYRAGDCSNIDCDSGNSECE